jgi:hypothetical protein
MNSSLTYDEFEILMTVDSYGCTIYKDGSVHLDKNGPLTSEDTQFNVLLLIECGLLTSDVGSNQSFVSAKNVKLTQLGRDAVIDFELTL